MRARLTVPISVRQKDGMSVGDVRYDRVRAGSVHAHGLGLVLDRGLSKVQSISV
jgi:hypothetical protein